jgi:hypothetical protein
MNKTTIRKKFIFNEKIDSAWLFSLYEDDYEYIAEVFNSSLDSFKEDLPAFTGAFETSDITTLKKSAHKIKPVFGFAGLLHHQEMMGRFENACLNASNTSNLTMHYIELLELIQEGKNIIQEEYNRLTAFTS